MEPQEFCAAFGDVRDNRQGLRVVHYDDAAVLVPHDFLKRGSKRLVCLDIDGCVLFGKGAGFSLKQVVDFFRDLEKVARGLDYVPAAVDAERALELHLAREEFRDAPAYRRCVDMQNQGTLQGFSFGDNPVIERGIEFAIPLDVKVGGKGEVPREPSFQRLVHLWEAEVNLSVHYISQNGFSLYVFIRSAYLKKEKSVIIKNTNHGIMRLIFVYNADGSLISLIKDTAHKLALPATYPCNLCRLTYPIASMDKTWKNFIASLPHDVVFLHRDEFQKKYPGRRDAPLPAVFQEDSSGISLLVSREEIDAAKNLSELIQVIQRALPIQHHG